MSRSTCARCIGSSPTPSCSPTGSTRWRPRSSPSGNPRPGKRIAVVGAGPAGLTASFYLALLGHEVVVHESHAEPGGMLRYALPGYRLPRNVLDREIEIIRRLGVQFVLNSRIGADISLADLEDQFDAVFLSLGTWKETQVRIARQRPGRCVRLAAFPRGRGAWQADRSRRRAVIIGGGNSAIDCARTAIRKGRSATVIYRRERKDMPAIAEEVDAAEEEGVKLHLPRLAASHRRRTRRGQRDRGHQDTAWRLRYVGPPAPDRHRRSAGCAVQHRHPGSRRKFRRRIRHAPPGSPPSRAACWRLIATT